MAGEPTSGSGQASDVPTPNRKPKKRQQQQQLTVPLIAEPPAAATPKTPRPALRRNTSYDAPEEREKADWAEQRATQRQLRSMTDARQRADRLAISVGSYSGQGSRRNSNDFDVSFQPLIDDSDDLDKGPADDAVTATEVRPAHDHHHHVKPRTRTPHSRRRNGSLQDDQAVAETLVRSYTVRDRGRDLYQRNQSSSGTHTPVSQQEYTQDYVPRPSKYRGGILSSLLRLNNDERGAGAGSSSSGAPSTRRRR
ncbi:hypothetical protein CDD83_204 [Cordyceps sp. RAO-2017]|nr:hypothetical protein CDD83_204 [Cordyceps sp. RAO-2017]